MKFYTTLKLLSVPVKQLPSREHISPYLYVAMRSILADVTWEPSVPYFLNLLFKHWVEHHHRLFANIKLTVASQGFS